MILVTGATGLVGSFITRKLIEEGYKVRILVRKSSSLELISDIQSLVEIVEGDILDIPSLDQAFNNVRTVIHAAALVSFNPKDTNKLLKINVEGTANMVNLALIFNVQKFIHISSIAAIGSTSDSHVIDEETKWNPNDYHSNYAISKHQSELEVWRATEEGLKAIIINPSVVLGPSNYTKSSAKIFNHAKRKGFFTIPSSMNVVDVRDVAATAVALLNTDIENQRFIINAEQITFTNIITEIRHHFGLKPPLFTLPLWLLKIYAYLNQLLSAITFRHTQLTLDTVRSLTRPVYYDGSKITKVIQLKYTTCKDSLTWCCK